MTEQSKSITKGQIAQNSSFNKSDPKTDSKNSTKIVHDFAKYIYQFTLDPDVVNNSILFQYCPLCLFKKSFVQQILYVPRTNICIKCQQIYMCVAYQEQQFKFSRKGELDIRQKLKNMMEFEKIKFSHRNTPKIVFVFKKNKKNGQQYMTYITPPQNQIIIYSIINAILPSYFQVNIQKVHAPKNTLYQQYIKNQKDKFYWILQLNQYITNTNHNPTDIPSFDLPAQEFLKKIMWNNNRQNVLNYNNNCRFQICVNEKLNWIIKIIGITIKNLYNNLLKSNKQYNQNNKYFRQIITITNQLKQQQHTQVNCINSVMFLKFKDQQKIQQQYRKYFIFQHDLINKQQIFKQIEQSLSLLKDYETNLSNIIFYFRNQTIFNYFYEEVVYLSKQQFKKIRQSAPKKHK